MLTRSDIEAVIVATTNNVIPAIAEAFLKSGKHVLVGAFSSGLSDKLTERADQFVQLDGYFFDLSKSPQAHSDGESHAP